MIIEEIIPHKVDYHITKKNYKNILSKNLKIYSIKKEDYLELTKFFNSEKTKQYFSDKILYILPPSPKYILVVSTRIEQLQILQEKIEQKLNIKCDYFYGKRKAIEYDRRAQVLLAGVAKAGVGFNDPRFKVCLYASDINNIEQVFGRIRCDDGIHFDFVDDHYIMENHFNKRMTFYRKSKVKVLDYQSGPGGYKTKKPLIVKKQKLPGEERPRLNSERD